MTEKFKSNNMWICATSNVPPIGKFILVAVDDDVFFAKLESVNEEELTIKTFCIFFFDEEELMFSRWIVEDFLWCEKPGYPRNLK